MKLLVMASELVIALALLNVWLLRAGKPTQWRAGQAQNMREEFAAYGLPPWFMWVIGFVKVSLAIFLIVGLWLHFLARPAAIGVAILMLGAIAMHAKVKDPLKKAVPALSLLLLSVIVAVL